MPPADPKDTAGDTGPEGAGRLCPICGKPAAEATRPFCSSRCRDVDLNRWLTGSYVVPASDDDPEDGE
jgi:endogenous inhibitor of DNA gyrase (YacG/DUF329 family)